MATQPDSLCFTDAPPIAAEVARGVTRLFCRQDLFAVCEMPLPNGRRADLMAIDAKGGLTIVEIKVARADLLGDGKWFDYLDYCDRFFWAVPRHLAKILEEERYLPGEAATMRRSSAKPPTGRCRRRGARPSCCGSRAGRRGAFPRRSIRRSATLTSRYFAAAVAFGFLSWMSLRMSRARESRCA